MSSRLYSFENIDRQQIKQEILKELIEYYKSNQNLKKSLKLEESVLIAIQQNEEVNPSFSPVNQFFTSDSQFTCIDSSRFIDTDALESLVELIPAEPVKSAYSLLDLRFDDEYKSTKTPQKDEIDQFVEYMGNTIFSAFS